MILNHFFDLPNRFLLFLLFEGESILTFYATTSSEFIYLDPRIIIHTKDISKAISNPLFLNRREVFY
jgi:hypothetical protein